MKIKTAEDLFLEKYGNKITASDSWVLRFAIDYAQYHVTEALKQASEKAELDYHNGSCRECGSNKIDEKSILNAYDLNNIK